MAISNEVSKLKLSEHELQARVITWAESMALMVPELGALYAIPNQNILFSKISKQHRYQAINYMKAEGLKKGVPDLHLPVARGGFHSLYIEMKTETGRASDEQETWADRLSDLGNLVIYCYDDEQAIQVITDYLNGAYTIRQ